MRPPGERRQVRAVDDKVHRCQQSGGCFIVGQADPYCMLRVGAQEQQTKVAQGGGKKPVWGDTFDFDISNEKELVNTGNGQRSNG